MGSSSKHTATIQTTSGSTLSPTINFVELLSRHRAEDALYDVVLTGSSDATYSLPTAERALRESQGGRDSSGWARTFR